MYLREYISTKNGPAAPYAAVKVINPIFKDRLFETTALIDSGSDATAMSIESLKQIDARLVQFRYMRGITGTRVRVRLFEVSIQIGPFLVPGLEVIGIPNPEDAVIGRDVLNSLICHLDGLAQEFRVVDGLQSKS